MLNAYSNPEAIFNDYCLLLRGLALKYLRRKSVKLVNDASEYSPVTISSAEVTNYLEFTDSDIGEDWLDRHEFPQEFDVDNYIVSIRQMIETNRSTITTPVGLEALRRYFLLSEFEVRFLVAAIAVQIDEDFSRFLRFVNGEHQSTLFTVGFFLKLLTVSQEDFRRGLITLSKTGKLAKFHLIDLGLHSEWNAHTPTLYAPVTVPERIVSYVLGITDVEEPLIACQYVSKLTPLTQLIFPDGIADNVYNAIQGENPRVGLYGRPGSGRRSLLLGLAQSKHRNLIEVDLSSIQNDDASPEEIQGYFASWFREAYLKQAYLLFRLDKPLGSAFEKTLLSIIDALSKIIREFNSCICVCAPTSSRFMSTLFGELVEIHFPAPTSNEQQMFWECALRRYVPAQKADTLAELLSIGYCLTPGEIETTIHQTLARLQNSPDALDVNSLSETLHKTRGRELEGLAEYRSTALTLKDVVLTKKALETVKNIINHSKYSDTVRNEWGFAKYAQSATGLSVLFSGPPGTGKTLTASVLAHELRRALYVVDLSRIVDKYVGETEKNLARIFDQAENSQAVLLFDECDSLFAKRTSVRSSNDRYANLEVNYLLQRLESYSGISILTTNFAASLNEALSRRIQFKVEFPQPDAKQRAELWKRIVPANAPQEMIDFKALGEHFNMSGGHIKNAVFRGCIFAASQHEFLTTDHLWEAALQEYREMGHVVRDEDGENVCVFNDVD